MGRDCPFRFWLMLVLTSGAWLCLAEDGAPPRDPMLSGGLVIRSWKTGDGLPQNTVNSVLQTRDGYLWLGTREGLARFDGVRFTVFGLAEGLHSVEVLALIQDRQGTLWIGTGGGGLSRMVNGRIETLTLPENNPLTTDVVTSLAEDNDGYLWVGSPAGLSLWKDGRLVARASLARLEQAPIRAILRGYDGTMWVATTTYGLFEFKEDRLTSLPGPPGNENIVAYCLLEDQAGNLWASVGNGTILCRREGQWGKYTQSDGLPFAFVTSMAQEADGTIWAGSLDDGLYRLDGNHFVAIRQSDGLSADDIRSLRPDEEGNLWVGTRTGGLNRLHRRKLVHCGAAQGLTNEFTRSVAETPDGSLFVGTIGGGLYQGGPAGFSQYAPEPVARFYASVESVLATPRGELWWGGARAVLRVDQGKLLNCYTNESWIRTASLTALCPDKRGGLWLGTSEGRLIRFHNEQFHELPERVARGAITALAQQSDGLLWVGSVAGGLTGIYADTGTCFSLTNGLISQAIRALYIDKDNTLWIGTAGAGLGRWRHGRATTFTTRQGLGADTISQIVEDDYGNLWLGSSRGIFRISKAALNDVASGTSAFLHPRSFGINDGMAAEECSSGFCPAGLKTSSGLICFSTVKGLVFVDPRRQTTNSRPPRLLLEEVLINGSPQPSEPLPRPIGGLSPGIPQPVAHLTVPPGGREVEIQYTAISFSAPEKVRFRYRLEPIAHGGRTFSSGTRASVSAMDPGWVEAAGRRVAYFPRIPPGDYVFRVLACNADGIWNEAGLALAITSQPYLWQRSWFVVLAGVSLAFAFAASLRWLAQRKYRRRLAVLQMQNAVERERLRISQDMHDHIGGMLTQVSQLSDLAQSDSLAAPDARGQFQRIGTHARAAVQALDEIVWATNPRNDNLPRFAEYVSRFADEFFESSPIRCWQEVPPEVPDLPLRADLRHNVFLAIREAFHNVLKHSNATQLWLRLTYEDSKVRLEIEDNGRGFSPEEAHGSGNGLENMNLRLRECGGRAEIRSTPGQGTTIRFEFPARFVSKPAQG